MTATMTIHGGLTATPELRYSQSGAAIASGTVASTDRYLDRQSNEWKDGKKLFLRFSAFKDLAEHIAASQLEKGAQVVVTGRLLTREYEDREGNKRSSTELEVIDFAVSLRRATAQVTRAARQDGQGQMQSTPAASSEPWTTPSTETAADEWATGGLSNDVPF